MQDLFQRLNNTESDVDIYTFSESSSHRSQKPFPDIYFSASYSLRVWLEVTYLARIFFGCQLFIARDGFVN
ncbi:transposase [Cylindrospermum sp. NIES-4074]|nr:transposase [Cylindrospermum sp. NIES-4074]